MLTVACVLVAGPVKGYSVDYVVRLERMVRRYLARPFRFVCLTDGTRGALPSFIDTIQIPSSEKAIPENGRGYWAKLQVFNPAHQFTGRMLYLDLDTLVVAPLDPIVDFPALLALTADAFVVERAHLNTDRYGRRLVRRFNGSVMVWEAGTCAHLFTAWTPQDAQELSTDQDWIGEQAPDAQGMPYAWFPRISQLVKDPSFAAKGRPIPPEAKVILTKKPKNDGCVEQWPWFEPLWGGWAA